MMFKLPNPNRRKFQPVNHPNQQTLQQTKHLNLNLNPNLSQNLHPHLQSLRNLHLTA